MTLNASHLFILEQSSSDGVGSRPVFLAHVESEKTNEIVVPFGNTSGQTS